MSVCPWSPGSVGTHPTRAVFGSVSKAGEDGPLAVSAVFAEALTAEVIMASVFSTIEADSPNSLYVPLMAVVGP
jgi:hypothetical protein